MATVLIIEDDPQMARMLGALMEFEGYRAVLCPAPERALDCVRETRPDVVVMDFHLGRTRAPGLLQALRADPELRTARVIIVSPPAPPAPIASCSSPSRSKSCWKRSGSCSRADNEHICLQRGSPP